MKSFESENPVYGGVKWDFAMMGGYDPTAGENAAAGNCLNWYFTGLLDFPFSLVADTVLLPWTATRQNELYERSKQNAFAGRGRESPAPEPAAIAPRVYPR